MENKVKLVAPCGVYCGICPIYIADKGNIERLKERIAARFGVSTKEVSCYACRSGRVFLGDTDCTVKRCTIERGLEGCFQCHEFPCKNIEGRPDPIRGVILRSVPALRELGIESFIEEEEERYRCPHCGQRLFMGARRCWNCRSAVDLD